MENTSHFESRSGKISYSDKEIFAFITDIRNFERFIPQGTIANWQAEKDSCSFNVSMIGNVVIRLAEKEMYSKVVFLGDALKKNDFSLGLHISGIYKDSSDVKITLDAQLNPMMKMMAAKPISGFLEMLVNEMESFRGWRDIKE